MFRYIFRFHPNARKEGNYIPKENYITLWGSFNNYIKFFLWQTLDHSTHSNWRSLKWGIFVVQFQKCNKRKFRFDDKIHSFPCLEFNPNSLFKSKTRMKYKHFRLTNQILDVRECDDKQTQMCKIKIFKSLNIYLAG